MGLFNDILLFYLLCDTQEERKIWPSPGTTIRWGIKFSKIDRVKDHKSDQVSILGYFFL